MCRWAALGAPQRSGLAQKGLYSHRGLAEHPFGTRAASALRPAGSPRKMLTNHEWTFYMYDWVGMRLRYELAQSSQIFALQQMLLYTPSFP